MLPFVAALLGCARHPVAATPALDPPYRVDPRSPTHLLVRQDLDAQLVLARAARGTGRGSLVGFGRAAFAPDASYAVRVPFPSFVEQVRVAVDAHVAPGTPLLVLRSSEVARLRAEFRAAQVAHDAERVSAERVARLLADGTASEREVQEATTRLRSSATLLAGLQTALSAAGIEPGGADRYVLRARSAGRVLARGVEPGERVSPDDREPAILVGDPDRLVVRAAFPERDAPWLDDARACSFVVGALGSERLDGTLTEIRRAVDPRTRSVVATCTPHVHDRRLAAEMVARVEVPVQDHDALAVPRSALLLRRDEHVVFVRLGPRRLERRRVEPGATLGETVQIRAGLADGDEVVARGALLLDGELDQVL